MSQPDEQAFKVGDLVEWWNGNYCRRESIVRMTASTAWLGSQQFAARKSKFRGWPFTRVTDAQIAYEHARAAWKRNQPPGKYVSATYDDRLGGGVHVRCDSDKIEDAILELRTIADWFAREPKEPSR